MSDEKNLDIVAVAVAELPFAAALRELADSAARSGRCDGETLAKLRALVDDLESFSEAYTSSFSDFAACTWMLGEADDLFGQIAAWVEIHRESAHDMGPVVKMVGSSSALRALSQPGSSAALARARARFIQVTAEEGESFDAALDRTMKEQERYSSAGCTDKEMRDLMASGWVVPNAGGNA